VVYINPAADGRGDELEVRRGFGRDGLAGFGRLEHRQNRVCISELADAGSGASNGFEYLEIFVE
jgi:hypothetical protein